MKILHIIPTYRPAYGRGGPIWSVHNFNKALSERGHDVTIYTTDIDIPKGEVPLNEPTDVDGLEVVYFPESWPYIWEYWRVGFIPMFFPRAWEYSRDMHIAMRDNIEDFDIVHITSTFLAASTLGGYYSKKADVPYVISPRGNFMVPMERKLPYLKKPYIYLFEFFSLKDAIIHCTVEKEKQDHIRKGIAHKDFITIPNGVDLDELDTDIPEGQFREKYDIDKNRPVVLFLGRLSWKKGLDTLVPSMKKVLEEVPEALLVIAGSSSDNYGDKVKKWVEEEGIEGNTLFTGWISGDDKFSALQDSDIFVLPSYSENFGMAAVEAMYFELPVVLTPKVGIAEEVRESRAGLITEKDEDDFAQAVVSLLRDESMASNLGKNGKRLVEEKFAMDQIAHQWEDAYQKIISEYTQQSTDS